MLEMNSISEINQWCMRRSILQPVYTFIGSGTEWKCQFRLESLNINCESDTFTCKADAKLHAATRALSLIYKDNSNESINNTETIIRSDVIILLDGDQRVDCWRWLNQINIDYDNNIKIYVFVGPTSHCEPIKNDTELIVSKSTSRDSADAALLIMLGRLLPSLSETTEIIIVSADHILVQAAIDYKFEYAINLQQLKSILLKGTVNSGGGPLKRS